MKGDVRPDGAQLRRRTVGNGALFGEELLQPCARDELILHHEAGARDLRNVRDDLGDVRRRGSQRTQENVAAQDEQNGDDDRADIADLLEGQKDGVVLCGQAHFAAVEFAHLIVAGVKLPDFLLFCGVGAHDAHRVHILLHVQIDLRIAVADGAEELARLRQVADEKEENDGRDDDGKNEKEGIERRQDDDGEHDHDRRIEQVHEDARIQFLEGDGVAVHRREQFAHVVAGDGLAV